MSFVNKNLRALLILFTTIVGMCVGFFLCVNYGDKSGAAVTFYICIGASCGLMFGGAICDLAEG